MAGGCATCRHRKVKCDGRLGSCVRCEKLGVGCQWAEVTGINSSEDGALTQAGYKRLRTSAACEPCRKRKLKCDTLRPSCGTCLRLKATCSYDSLALGLSSKEVNERTGYIGQTGRGVSQEKDSEQESSEDGFLERGGDCRSPTSSRSSYLVPTSQAPLGSNLLLYIDAFLQNVHPVGCNNFLHPGVLGEALGKAPQLLILALCGVTAKFARVRGGKEQGRCWTEEARSLVFKSLEHVSTMNVTILQFLATHDMQEGRFTSAWNLSGMATRMALQLKLNRPPVQVSPQISTEAFLQEECHRRLMWSVFVSDLLFAFDESRLSEKSMADIQLPCNLWNFTQGTPCTTLRLSQVSEQTAESTLRQATNPCAYLIKVLVIRRKIVTFINRHKKFGSGQPWVQTPEFNALKIELETWRRSLPTNFEYEQRNMFTFRASCHLDIFLMIHIWYHASGCELFGAWMPGHEGSLPMTNFPEDFLVRCREGALDHASGITKLVEKTLKLEPDHLFRDAWFGVCLLDSARILIAGFQSEASDEEKSKTLAESLKLHLRALDNTRKTIVVDEKIYQEVCILIRNSGFAEAVGLKEDNYQVTTQPLGTEGSVSFFRRYSFLAPESPPESSGWNHLFNAADFAGSVPDTRDPSPGYQEPPADTPVTQYLTNMPEMPYALPDQLYSTPWPPDEFQWQPLDALRGIPEMNTRQGIEPPMMGGDHSLVGFSSSSFSPTF